MECPYCHKEMRKGRIQTQGGVTLFWVPEGRDVKFASQSTESVRLGKCSFWKAPSAESWYCPDCKKVITDAI